MKDQKNEDKIDDIGGIYKDHDEEDVESNEDEEI